MHYVSPSVWAWRQGRLKKIARAVDLVLTLFPFEEAFYRKREAEYPGLRAICVGHPLADSIPMETDTVAARAQLSFTVCSQAVALLPGSRAGEVQRMGKLFLDVARWCARKHKNLCFVMPAANPAREKQLRDLLVNYPDVPVRLVSGESKLCMAASDVVLMASGTTTLEAMLLKKPMVVAYKMSAFSYAMISRLLKVPYVSLPNLLADECLVPELMQDNATVENLGNALLAALTDISRTEVLKARFAELHQDLRRNASESAAKAILELLQKPAKVNP